jgi:hypothetical protein
MRHQLLAAETKRGEQSLWEKQSGPLAVPNTLGVSRFQPGSATLAPQLGRTATY